MAKNVKTKEKGAKLGTWKPFLTLMTSVKVPWVWVGLATLVSLFGAQLSLIIPDATAKVAVGDVSLGAILFMVGCMFLSALETSVRQIFGRIASSKTEMNFQKLMLKKNLSLPMPFFDKNMANRLITRTTSDSTLIAEFFGWSVPYIPSAIYRLVGVVAILGSYNWRLVALEGIMFPIIILVTILSGRVGFTWNNRIQSKIAELGGYLAETLANIPLIKVFVKEKTEEKKGKEAIDGIYTTRKKSMFVLTLVGLLSSAESILQTIVVVVGGAVLVNAGHINLEQWIAFYLYAQTLVGTVQSILQYYETIKRAQGASRRMAEIIVEPSEDMGGSEQFPEQPGDIHFEDVTFRYDTNTVLKNVSFTLPAGKTTALVGPSGAGKSTIFGLLERFYEPESGSITLDGVEAVDPEGAKIIRDGVDAKEFNKSSWRQAIGYVPQSSPMFSGTIRSNMTYGLNRTVSDEELIQAAKDANIYEFIQSCEDGFDTDVGERGSKVSGGQRQRIAIARALLKDPKILLLDEATSNLDPEARAEVEKAIARLKEGRTTVIVAHEIRSIEDADQIVVLSSGEIDGVGRDAQLMQDNALYRRLKELQSDEAVLEKA